MDHGAAHERIEDLLLEPQRLAALEASTDPDDVALRLHLASCRACRAELDAWRDLQRGLATSVPRARSGARSEANEIRADAAVDGDPDRSREAAVIAEAGALLEPIVPPASLRDRVVAAIRGEARPPEAISIEPASPHRARRSRVIRPWFAVAASLVILVGAGIVTIDQASRRAHAEAEAAALATLAAAVDNVLAADHRIVELRRPDGSTAGSISWSRHDWVVLTSALSAPAADQQYKCWLQDGPSWKTVGVMEFAAGRAYWVATVDDWQTWEIGPETNFVVTLEPEGAQSRTGPTVLSAELRS